MTTENDTRVPDTDVRQTSADQAESWSLTSLIPTMDDVRKFFSRSPESTSALTSDRRTAIETCVGTFNRFLDTVSGISIFRPQIPLDQARNMHHCDAATDRNGLKIAAGSALETLGQMYPQDRFISIRRAPPLRSDAGSEADVVSPADRNLTELAPGQSLRTADGAITFTRNQDDPRIATIRIANFEENRNTSALLNMIRANPGIQGFVLDLRDNPGGFSNVALRTISLFLRDGVIQHRDMMRPGIGEQHFTMSLGEREILYNGESHGLTRLPYALNGRPLVVLANGGTVSAGEVVVGALRDNGIPVVGTTTWGKGTGFLNVKGPEDTSVSATNQIWRTPNGDWAGDANLNRIGLAPTIHQREYFGIFGPLQQNTAVSHLQTLLARAN